MRYLFLMTLYWGTIPVMFIDPFYGIVHYTLINIIRPEQLLWGGGVGRIFLADQIVCFLSWLVNKGKLTPEDTPLPRQIKILCFLGVGMIFSSMNAVYPEWSWRWTSGFLKAVFFCFLLSKAMNTAKKLERYYAVTILWWTLLEIWGIQQKTLGNAKMEGIGGNLLPEINGFTAFVVMYLPMAYYSIFSTNKKIKYFLGIPSIIVFVIFVIFGGSRGGFLGMVTCFGVIFLRAKGFQKIKMVFASTLLFALLVAILIIFFPAEYTQEWVERIETITGEQNEETGKTERDASSASRLAFWKSAIYIYVNHREYWLTGAGMDGFTKVYGQYAAELAFVLEPEDYEYASVEGRWSAQLHNTYLGVLFGGGLLVFLPWIILICYSWIQAHNIPKKYPKIVEGVNIHNYAYAIEAGLAGICVCMLFGNREFIDFLYWHLTIPGIIVNLGKAKLKREELGKEDGEFIDEPVRKLVYAPYA